MRYAVFPYGLEDHDVAMHAGVGAPIAGPRKLVVNGSKLYVETDVAGVCVPLHLDTGANTPEVTGINTEQHPAQIQVFESRTRHLAGESGVREDDVPNWPVRCSR